MYIDLNNYFKLNFINFIFIKSYNLQKTSLSVLILQTVNSLYIFIYNVWYIPIITTDFQRTTYSFIRLYIAIDKDSKFENNLILLLKTTFINKNIYLNFKDN